MCFSHLLKKIEKLPGFLGNRAGVEGSGEILCQVNTKEFSALDDLRRCSAESGHSVLS